MEQNTYPDLQICEDMRQQRIEWTIERVAWFFLYALLIGIVLGLLGQGPLASARLQGGAGSLQMEYSRFMRNKSSDQLEITLPPAPASVRLMLDKQYLEHIEVRMISPPPEKVIARADSTVFEFNVDSPKPVQVHFHFEPRKAGALEGWVAVEGGERRKFSQFVYP